MKCPSRLRVCMWILILSAMNADFLSAGSMNRAAAADVQSPEEAPAPTPGKSKLRMRSFGRLPEWTKESWFIRRQVDPQWMLRGANVIDIFTGDVRENVNIVVAGDRIQSISTGQASERIKVVDASGLYVIPGLFDLHAHVIPKTQLFPGAPPPEEA